MSITTPPGWYVDQNQPNAQRYWNGREWTQYTAPLTVNGKPYQAKSSSSVAIIVGVVVGVVVLFTVSAVVAIPVFFSQRGKAVDSAMRSDLINASLAMEGYYSINNAYPTSGTEATAPNNPQKFYLGLNNTLTIATDGTTGYCIAVTNPTSKDYRVLGMLYDSNKGGMQPPGSRCSVAYPDVFSLQRNPGS
jgi:type IV pilus assembly protein PilA